MPLFGKKKPEDMKDEDLFKKGAEALTKQNWEEASEYLRILVKKNPQIIQAREFLTLSLIQEQKVDEALEHVKYLLNIDDQNPIYYIHLGSCYQLQGKIDDAIKELAHSLELKEDPKIRGMMLYLKTPDLPLIKIGSIDNSASNLFAKVLSNLELPEEMQTPELSQATSELAKLGNKTKDEIIDRKDPGVFMKEIADTCIENDCYVNLKDLLRKLKDINEVKKQIGLLKSHSGIKGWFAKFYELEFVQFEKIESK